MILATTAVSAAERGLPGATPRLDTAEKRTVSQHLAELSDPDRANATLALVQIGTADPDIRRELDSAEALWNRDGHYLAALSALRTVESLGIELIADISWKDPTAHAKTIGGVDSQIGAGRGRGRQVVLDFDRATGYILAAVRWTDAPNTYNVTLHRSTDGGDTWVETEYLTGTSVFVDIDMVAVGGYLYLAWVYGIDGPARLARWDAATGATNFLISVVNVSPHRITDVALAANSDGAANRIYYALIQDDGALRLFWDEASDGQTFTENSTGITDAAGGLDFDWNHESSSMFLSFITTAGPVRVHRGALATRVRTFGGTPATLYPRTAISVYGDNVVVIFYSFTPEGQGIGFSSSSDGGDSWPLLWKYLEYHTSALQQYYLPDVTARGGQGFGLVYTQYTDPPNPIHFRWAPYGSSYATEWTNRDTVNDGDAGPVSPPAISWIPPGYFCVAYIDADGAVFFDRIGLFFADGFETGGTTKWSSTVP